MEWADIAYELFPEETLVVRIEKDIQKGADYRRITIGRKSDEDTCS